MSYRVPKSVQVFLFREGRSGREFLLLHRTDSRGGFWQPVTGRVEPGETEAETAGREVAEETGVVSGQSAVPLNFVHRYPLKEEWLVNYPPGTTHNEEYAFAVSVPPDAEIRIDPTEHDAFVWLPLEAALEKLVWPGNREALTLASRLPG